MPKQPATGQNLSRAVESLTGEQIRKLNEVVSGAGDALHSAINLLAKRIDATAGHRGTVVLKANQKRNQEGKRDATLNMSGGRQIGLPDPEDDDEPITLGWIRKYLQGCRWFEQKFDECIDIEDQEAAVAGGGVVPFFTGYTGMSPPAEADTLISDCDTGYYTVLWSTSIPEPTTFSTVSYNLSFYDALNTFTPFINFGIYDSDLNLVVQTGPIDIRASGADSLEGPFTFTLEDEFTIESGEYFYAFCSGTCLRIWCIAANEAYTELVNESVGGVTPRSGRLNGQYYSEGGLGGTSVVMQDSLVGQERDPDDGDGILLNIPIGYWSSQTTA